jgi:hypothetical protein
MVLCAEPCALLGQGGGGKGIGKTRCGRRVNILVIVGRHEPILSASTHSVNYHEVTLVQLSFDFYMMAAKREPLIGDRSYATRWDR